MRPDVVLGFDPAPGDPTLAIRTADAVHTVIRGVVEARAGLDGLGGAGSVWDGPLGATVVGVLRRFSGQVAVLEETLIDLLAAVDRWREGLDERQAEVADLVARVADLGGIEEGRDRRALLVGRAREVELAHQRAARSLATAFETASTTVRALTSGEGELADDLEAALRALAMAVEAWVDAEGPAVLKTAGALAEVAALTTVLSELVGVTGLERAPDDAEGVRALASRSPAAHRLLRALRQRWPDLAAAELPAASFATNRRRTDLSVAVAERLAGDEPASEG